MLFHRYILWNVAVTSLGAILMFAFIVLLGEFMRDLFGMLAEGQVTVGTCFRLVGLLLPYVFVHALPMGLLTGIMISMGRLSSQGEVVALRASGVSIARLASSVVFLAILGVVTSIAVNFEFGPRAINAYRGEIAEAVRTGPLRFIIPRKFVKDFPGFVVYAGAKEDDVLRELWIWKLDDGGRTTSLIKAESGTLELDEYEQTLRLLLRSGSIAKMDSKDPEDFSEIRGELSFGSFPLEFPIDSILEKKPRRVKMYWLVGGELMSEWRRLDKLLSGEIDSEVRREAARMLAEAKMAFHEKLAAGVSVLSFALMAIPLGISVQRKETSANLGIALGLGVLYYLMTALIGWGGGQGMPFPHLLYWIPNFLLQGIGLWLIYRLDHGLKSKVKFVGA
ncbi:putative permease, YjgP/YjgQ family [Verrucomicrobiia bacterium DG1235]|nr:putative permease, YjgP/YjgQ family [Verrucomicrobiae bacterium DG1235]